MVWDSKTGNVKRFVDKLGVSNIEISKDLILNEPFVLITYTTGFGQVPATTESFLEKNSFFLRGVAVSGNKNWGLGFTKPAELISERYSVPIIHRFELSGTVKDVEILIEGLRKINGR